MKTTLIALLLGVAPILGDVDTKTPQHAATISLQRIATESAEGRAVNQQLQSLAQKLAGDLQTKQKELQGATAGDPRQAEFQRLAQQSQVEFANAQRQAQTDLRTKLSPVIGQIAAQQHVDLVLNSDVAVVWSAAGLDLTEEVLNRLNGASPAAKPGQK